MINQQDACKESLVITWLRASSVRVDVVARRER
jgi:hypothetical protein